MTFRVRSVCAEGSSVPGVENYHDAMIHFELLTSEIHG